MKAIKLRTEQKVNPIGIDGKEQFLSWICEDGISQSAYQIKACTGDQTIYDSGKVASQDMHHLLELNLESRQRVCWKVRLWDEKDEAGEWSEEAYFEMGLLSDEDWNAQWINPELSKLTTKEYDCSDAINAQAKREWETREIEGEYEVHQPASYLRRVFSAPEGTMKRFYITCHGLYEAWLNGKRVGDAVLMPGSSNYNNELIYQTYDVADLLREGENELVIVLGDGWYRSTSGVDGDRGVFGQELGLLCQLEVDGESVLVSDETWEASQAGPLQQNDMQQGEVYDARKETFATENGVWHPVKTEDFDKNLLKGMNTVPIKEMENFEGKLIQTPNGETIIDFGQNLAGYLEFTVFGKDGETIVLTHGESLDENGNFTTENFQDRKRHKEGGTYQMISYICKDGENHYKPRFTIMGFRYAKVETILDLSDATFIAHAVYSEMEETADFTCGNADVNQLVWNSKWSQKGNFCDVPTDCPTRERAAWTGDAGLYVDTGLMLMDSYNVYRKWLAQCRYGQYPEGKVANIAPPNSKGSFMTAMLAGSVGWGDACIIVPMAMYRKYGDVRILEENYEMMKNWYAFLESRAENNAIQSGIDYGEWCEPGTNPMMSMQNGNFDVATAYFAHSGETLSEIAAILGKEEDAAHYREVSENAKKAFEEIFTKDGVVESERQCQYIRPIQFGLVNEENCAKNAEKLNELVLANDYHLNTGFLTTPAICGILCEYGYEDTAFKLLLQESAPGWLYAVKKGATTIWETWDGINEEGKPSESLNHYSYGAITGWLIGGVCGIQQEGRKITIKPIACKELSHAKAVYDSPVGTIESGWKYEGNKITFEFVIPVNTVAEVVLPNGERHELAPGVHQF